MSLETSTDLGEAMPTGITLTGMAEHELALLALDRFGDGSSNLAEYLARRVQYRGADELSTTFIGATTGRAFFNICFGLMIITGELEISVEQFTADALLHSLQKQYHAAHGG